MNTEFLDTLPEVENKFGIELEQGEKVVFTAKLDTFGTEKDRMLGADSSKFTLTNRRIVADNGAGIWLADLKEDVVDCAEVCTGKFIFKWSYFAVNLNKEVVFNDGKEKLNGFHFYFKKNDMKKIEAIMSKLK